MKSFFARSFVSRGLLLASTGAFLPLVGQAATSDIPAPEKRRSAMEAAAKLAKPGVAVPLPDDLPLPFGPAGFELSDAQERAAATAASGKATAGPKVASDRQTLEEIAIKFPPTGTIFIGDEPRLMFGKKTVKIGTHFTVPLNGQDYDLELINIDRTNFTLRLNREEITRPIKPAKSP
jgi:hypothetical protein